MNHKVRTLQPADRPWVRDLLTQRWHSPRIVTRGRVHQADELPGFVAELAGELAGLVTYRIDAGRCEIVSLDSLAEGQGLGSALVATVAEAARDAGCTRVWLITTNDNLHALRFYQKRGFVLVAVHRNALEISRRLKPEIALVGTDGIPLRDEIELEMLLQGTPPEQAQRR
jgi:ribosomal protein S18 acetylase RimI-like enzyme